VPLPAKRIAVLFHEGDRHVDLGGYIVDHLARFWREDGHEVVYLFGTNRFVSADLVLVHVNLSVVPDEYIDFASRYPFVLNGRVRDIRKSTTSKNLVRRADAWEGPVIVKSDLNFGGYPERLLGRGWLERRSRPWRGVKRVIGGLAPRSPVRSWEDYSVFDRLADVPDRLWANEDLVVEKFLPEVENGLYHLRMFQFLGDRWTCTRLASRERVIKANSSVSVERIEPHDDVVAWREELDIDYGKLDYVVHDGEAVLLDANKTTGASAHMDDEELRAMRRYQAEGLYAYLRD
jgi:hypothetical protein